MAPSALFSFVKSFHTTDLNFRALGLGDGIATPTLLVPSISAILRMLEEKNKRIKLPGETIIDIDPKKSLKSISSNSEIQFSMQEVNKLEEQNSSFLDSN